jgi:alcohol dehydrogenase
MRLDNRLEFSCPVKVLYGTRALEHLPFELEALNARKPLLLSDEAACRENRPRALVDAFRESGMEMGVVAALPAEVRPDLVHQLAAIYRDKDCDALLVMGAGPLADLSKWLNLVVSTGQDDLERLAGDAGGGIPLKPTVWIAPAAATGYEASGRAQFGQTVARLIGLMPDLVAIDARTVGAPEASAVIEAGLAALTIGAEGLLERGGQNPMVQIYATNAVQMAAAGLATADQLPEAVDPRLRIANAAAMAGCTLADRKPGRLLHLGRQLAATDRISLAGALGALLPTVVDFGARNWRWNGSALLRPLIGLEQAAITPASQRALRVTATLVALISNLFNQTEGRIPRTLGDAGFREEDLAPLTEACIDEAGAMDEATVGAILSNAMGSDPLPAAGSI